jgi:RNA polymerase sigma-70 factor (ECF subfamily)
MSRSQTSELHGQRLRVVDGEGPEDRSRKSPEQITEELIDRALEGDVDSWTRLYQDHFDGLLRFVAYSTGDVGVAEDVVQEAFALALVGLHKFDGRSAFSTWMRGIAANLIRKHWRKKQRRTRAYARLGELAERIGQCREDAPDQNVLRDHRAEALLAGLETLPHHLREAFLLSDVHGLPAAEAGEHLGISAGNVRVRAARARARLRERFEDLGLVEVLE